ncbi:Ada metal-binding domain-containing protein [Actinosynnema sp. NPDC051121]
MSLDSVKPDDPYGTDRRRLRAVLERDPGADGWFVYSVRTTGVYSRPSCASRPARPENVRFHRTADDAERAGFRACLRCRPQEPVPDPRHVAAVVAACARIERPGPPPALQELADDAGFSRFHFHRVFKAVTGLTPHAYLAARRADRVRDALARAETVTDAIYSAGFGSNGHFYTSAADILGMTPTSFRAGGLGVLIRHCTVPGPTGPVLVAVADRGVCAVLTGDRATPDDLVRQLVGTFHHARLADADRRLRAVVESCVRAAWRTVPAVGLPDEVRSFVLSALVRSAIGEITGEVVLSGTA